MGIFKDIWDRSKDGSKSDQRSLIRVALVSTAIFLVFMLVKKDNVIRWIGAGMSIARQERTISANDSLLKAMDAHLDALNNNRDTIEAFARENFQYCEQDEDVYLLK